MVTQFDNVLLAFNMKSEKKYQTIQKHSATFNMVVSHCFYVSFITAYVFS